MVRAVLGNHEEALLWLASAVAQSDGREHFRRDSCIHRANFLRGVCVPRPGSRAELVAGEMAPMVGKVASARTEGPLRRTVAHRERRPMLPSSSGDALGYIAGSVQ